MDPELLVGDRIEDGRKLLAELARNGFDVAVAAWVRSREEGPCSLYVGSPSVTPERVGDAYRTVYSCLSRIPDVSVGLLQIKLVPASNPIARDALAIRTRHPGRAPIRYHGQQLGNPSIEEAYIYPPVTGPMTPAEVAETAVRLMNSTGRPQPSTVTLRDGSVIRAIPVGIQRRQPDGMQLTLLDVAQNSERVVGADEVVNIQ